jgi:hypothetical protein
MMMMMMMKMMTGVVVVVVICDFVLYSKIFILHSSNLSGLAVHY